MERVGILVNKLQAQLQQQADIQNMLVTAQMLYTELLQQKNSLNGTPSSSKVAVFSPNNPPLFQTPVLEEETMVVYEKEEKPSDLSTVF